MSTSESLGGVKVTPAMRKILNKPAKYVSVANGGQRLRELYRQESLNFHPAKLSEFALLCYVGALDEIRKKVESKEAPNLTGEATGFGQGYPTLVVLGAQRLVQDPRAPKPFDHEGTLVYLLQNGAPANAQDVVGFTALHHLCECPVEKPALVRALLMNGADVNYRNRYGSIPLLSVFQTKQLETIDILMEFGADLDLPEADGYTGRKMLMMCGPQVTATVTKWIRKRNGEAELPREGGQKKCGGPDCSKKGAGQNEDKPLKNCARCQVEKYCSTECQKKAWPTHKKTCVPFDSSSTVTLKPHYQPNSDKAIKTFQVSEIVRNNLYPSLGNSIPVRNSRVSQVPQEFDKPIIVKVQVPWVQGESHVKPDDRGDLLVYTKKRDFACFIRWQDQSDGGKAYRKVVDVVRTEGIKGAKGYFAAELKSKDELVIKVSEILAEQPF